MLQKKWVRIALLLLPVLGIAAAVLLHDTAVFIARDILPPCDTYTLAGIYCPGCGLTRCILALMEFDILLAFRQNAVVVLLLTALMLLYAEVLLLSFGKDVHLLPRRPWFWILFGILAAIYFILRNFLPELMPVTIIL